MNIGFIRKQVYMQSILTWVEGGERILHVLLSNFLGGGGLIGQKVETMWEQL